MNHEVPRPKNAGWNITGYSHLGIQFALIFGLLLYGGILLDSHYDTGPFGTLVGVLFGFGVATYHLLKEIERFDKKDKGAGEPASNREGTQP